MPAAEWFFNEEEMTLAKDIGAEKLGYEQVVKINPDVVSMVEIEAEEEKAYHQKYKVVLYFKSGNSLPPSREFRNVIFVNDSFQLARSVDAGNPLD